MNPSLHHLLSRFTTRLTATILVLAALCVFVPTLADAQSISQSGLRCSDAITFCQSTFRTPFPTDSTILQESLPSLRCFTTASVTASRLNGVWYKLTVYQDGDLGFGIQPLNADGSLNSRANLDWALFRLTDSTQCGRLGTPIRCNSSSNGGLTGAITSDVPTSAFSEPISNVKRGDVFLLLVLNPDNYRFGYVIDMGFSSLPSLTMQTPLAFKSLSAPRNICQTNTLTVEISDNVVVNAVTTGVFSLVSARGVRRSITQVASQRFGITTSASPSALDNVFTIYLSAPIEQSETYTLSVRQTLLSVCERLSTTAQISGFITVGPRVEITGFREYCSEGAKISASASFRAYFWENARTGASVGTTQTIVVPEGEYRLTVIDNNGCQASTSAIVRSTTAITLGLSAKGGKTAFCNYGNGADGVFLEATPGFDRYEWFFNGTPQTGIATTGTTSEKYVFDAPGLYTVRAYVNGCESVSNSVRITMFPVPDKPTIQRVGNYLRVVNPTLPGANYYWIRRPANGRDVGVENGWDCSPVTNGTYYVRITNQNGCNLDSDTLGINLTAVRVRVETGSYSFPQSHQFEMQFRLTNVLNNAQLVGATSITLTLRFNAGLLWLSPTTQRGVLQDRDDTTSYNRFITVNFPLGTATNTLNTSVVVGTLRFLATVSGIPAAFATNATHLYLENIAFLTPNGKAIQNIRIDTTLGSFRLVSRLQALASSPNGSEESVATTVPNTTEAISITPHPNPNYGYLAVDFAVSTSKTEALVSAWLQDAYGRRIKTLLTDEPAQEGQYSREFDIGDIPQGTYFLIVRTQDTFKTAILSVTR